ncbi:aspartate/methionine/tyrosine aminotransferase [Amorphus orientalis]|uniref:aspartate transaminase n=2 Tax=Amorphus orientalis TaxID=649198 RepID=A0AAE3VMP6_9HYPH|nr:aspartate/methionine/tyrosine aminotransferase [Amorphus orientalis]
MAKPSKRGDVDPFLAMDVLADATRLEAEGRKIVHMEVGQPAAPAPQPALDAAREVLSHGRIRYTEALGRLDLRERISRHYRDEYGVAVAPERIAVTTGSSAGFMLAFLAGFDAGHRIALPTPGYPAYRNILKAVDLEAVEIETTAATRWALTPELLAEAHRQKPLSGVLVASPANPTGTTMTPDALSALIRAATDMGLWFISDEIYHGLVYDGRRAETALATSSEAIVINSFSKYYCMTGWRVGWMVVPERLVRTVERLSQNLYISVPELSQMAAAAAFDARDELERIRAVYAENRTLLLDGLPKLGVTEILPADGAFYLYADISSFSADSRVFARDLLHQEGVAVTPGLDFDPVRGHRYVRFSLAGSHADMQGGLDRLGRFLNAR